MPVAVGWLRSRLAESETKRVPRRRSSRMTGGRPDGRSVGRSGSCLPTTRPPTLQAYDTPGLLSGFGAAFGAGRGLWRWLWRACLGFADSHTHPNITRRSCSATGALGRLYVPPPREVHGHAQQHEDQTQECVGAGRVLYEQIDGDEAGQHNVEGRQEGIAWGFDGARDIRPFLSQPEDADGRDRIEHDGSEDHEVEQLPIGARQTQDAGPNRLDDQCQRGRLVSRMQIGCRLEEQGAGS